MIRASRNIFNFSSISSRAVQDQLNQLLQPQQFRMSIANAVKIFPTFFSLDYVKKFIQCKTFRLYLNHINQRENSDWQSLKRILKFDHNFTPLLLNKLQTDNTYAFVQAFVNWLKNDCLQFDERQNNIVMEWMDMRTPQNWFYNEYNYQDRVFIYNHGPTNSGKTAAAIQELRNLPKDKEGIYMAPLRLLAWETFQKLGHCNLITGQDKQYQNSNLTSCTIQTLNLNTPYELAVIDEIQIINDSSRGWAWTKAILGIQAKRIHLCGDERALNLISKLIKISGGRLQEKKYSRLSKLSLIHRNFRLDQISPGDAIIQFSTASLYSLRNQINKLKKKENQQKQQQERMEKQQILGQENESKAPQTKEIIANPNYCSIVYGKMPPQCRKNQAKLFNSSELPYLVATNAIGMGLNLKINRIIFVQITKMTNEGVVEDLQEHQIQQIAGRAGRGINTTGYVQCANRSIFRKVQKALQNVNKSYNIQLQTIDDGSEKENQNKFGEETVIQSIPQEPLLKIYNEELKRFLQPKQCQIEQAAIFVQAGNVEKIKIQIQKLINRKLSLAQTINFTIHCSKQNRQLYFIQRNAQFLQWVKIIQPLKFQLQEQFLVSKGLAITINKSTQSKEIRLEYARQLKSQRKVFLPQLIVKQYQSKFDEYVFIDDIPTLQKYYSLIQNYVWLWNQFQFSLPEIDKARMIKQQICHKIEQLLKTNRIKPYQPRIFQSKSPSASKSNMNSSSVLTQDQNQQSKKTPQVKVFSRSEKYKNKANSAKRQNPNRIFNQNSNSDQNQNQKTDQNKNQKLNPENFKKLSLADKIKTIQHKLQTDNRYTKK